MMVSTKKATGRKAREGETMVRTASLFAQLLGLFPRVEFQRAVVRHRTERYAKRLSSWDQFVAMLFCQLAQAQSLREICGGLAACLGKVVHLGVLHAPRRSTLSYANAHRSWTLYEEVFQQLLGRCQGLARGRRKFRFKNKLVSLDATVIDLCATLFPWAKFRQTKGAVKLHLLLDHEGYLPTFGVITEGRVHEVKIAQTLAFPAGTIVVMDRAYNDFTLFGRWTDAQVHFVTRIKENTSYRVVERRAVPENGGVIRDEVIALTSPAGLTRCPQRLRRIESVDLETGHELVFLTNHLEFAASTIARIYKDRWQIELFFKALKQNLKVKTFVGTSPNALRTQIWTALIAMLLLKYLQFTSTLNWALSNLVTFLRWNLFTYRDLTTWLNAPFHTPPGAPAARQLTFAFPGMGQHPA